MSELFSLVFKNQSTMILLLPAGILVVIATICLLIYCKNSQAKPDPKEENQTNLNNPASRRVGVRRRYTGGSTQEDRRVEDGDNGQAQRNPNRLISKSDGKVGAKKMAKLEAKAEMKAQREAEAKMREERKQRQEKIDQEKKLREDKEEEEENRREEEERKLKEEQEQKELEEYLKLKAEFTIEEEGYDQDDVGEEDLLQQFIEYIQGKKVVMLEDLAAKFHLRIQTVIDRLEVLQANGTLTGVIDDRGKFIYVTQSELEAVADFVKKRGRVLIQELVDSSNRLIQLN